VSALQPGAAWFAPFDPQLLATFNTPGWADALCARATALGLTNAQGLPLRFVRQEALPAGEPYEAFIHRTGQVPTRENAHDFFNAVMWLHLPRAKACLNALQAAAIARDGIGGQRGVLRDFCTLLDESALLMIAPPDLAALLRQRAWTALCVDARSRWQREVALLPFGHALLEKLCKPYKAITAQVMIWEISEIPPRTIHELFEAKMAEKAHEYCVLMDEILSETLQNIGGLPPQRLMPLPVLGIPQWWPANAQAQFYADTQVFRPLPTG
jgi:Protein of unknown function (DUF3025)